MHGAVDLSAFRVVEGIGACADECEVDLVDGARGELAVDFGRARLARGDEHGTCGDLADPRQNVCEMYDVCANLVESVANPELVQVVLCLEPCTILSARLLHMQKNKTRTSQRVLHGHIIIASHLLRCK